MTRPSTIALVLAALIPTLANAQTSGSSPDVTTIAKYFGISPAEAERRIALQTKASLLEGQLLANPAFGGLRIIQNAQSFRVLVKFKGRKPSASELTNDPELQAVLDVAEAARSRGDLISLQNRVAAAARARKIETMIFPDVVTGKVEVHVRDVEAFRAALADLNIDDDDVTLIKAEDFPQPHQGTITVKGGLQVTASLGGRCTIGFAATRGADKGLLTAGHCAILTQYGTASPDVTVSLPAGTFAHGASKWTAETDLAFFKNANTALTSLVYWGGGDHSMKSMSGGLAANGSMMCKMGSATGYGCHPVYNNWATQTKADGNQIGPMSTLYCSSCTETAQISAKGDSGGPVYINYVGYGIHAAGSAQYLWYVPVYRTSEISTTPTVSP